MIVIKLLLALIVPLLLGACVIALVFRNQKTLSPIERLALSWGIGLGLLGIEMFTLSLIGLPLNPAVVLTPISAFILGLMIYLIINKIKLFDLPQLIHLVKKGQRVGFRKIPLIRAMEYLLILMITLTVAYVFFDALVKPIVDFDDLWRQGCIAKIIFVTGKVLTEQTLELAGPHPFLNPLSQAWVYMMLDVWNDALGKIVFAACFVSLIALFYVNLRKETARIYALFFTYFLTAFPLIVYHAGTAYSDLMQTFYYSIGAIYLYRWLKDKASPDLSLSALFLGIGVFVKQIGTPFWGIALFVLLLYVFLEQKGTIRASLNFLLLSLLVAAPWFFSPNSFIARRMASFFTGFFGGGQTTAVVIPPSFPYGNPSLGEIIFHLSKRMFTYADWQILWFAFILCLLFCWRQIWDSKLKYLLLIIGLNLAAIVYSFFEPNAYQYLVDGTLVERMMMVQIPVILFFVGLCVFNIISKEPGRKIAKPPVKKKK
ncbi:MAG: hypothetical protein PHH14_08145 [Candidatus Margulisbacteria bacterium]|nr:hypothetical protein [Candidatus Margulisiibacteriota bacterium]